jgi:hypothetical protein
MTSRVAPEQTIQLTRSPDRESCPPLVMATVSFHLERAELPWPVCRSDARTRMRGRTVPLVTLLDDDGHDRAEI